MTETRKSMNWTYYLNTIIMLVFMFGFGMLSPVEPLTTYGMRVIGIFIGAVYGWSTIGLFVPSMLALVCLGFTEFGTVKETFTAGFGHDTTLFLLFIFAFSALVEQAGINEYIANIIMKMKIARGKPWVISFFVLFAAYISSALVSLSGSIVICWGIFYGICKQVGYTREDRYPKLMIMGIAFSAAIGFGLLPFKMGPVVVFGVLNQLSGLTVNDGAYVLFAFIFQITSILFYLAACKFIFRADVTRLKTCDMDCLKDITLDVYQKKVLYLLLAMVVMLLIPSMLPQTFFLAASLKRVGVTGIIALFVTLCIWLKHDGVPFVKINKLMSGVMWDIIFLIAAAMPLSSALTADGTGVKELLVQVLMPVFEGKSAFFFTVLLCTIALLLTNFANNTVVGLTLLPIMYSFSTEIGANPVMIAAIMINMMTIAFLTPAASPAGALLHGNKEWLDTKDVLQIAIVMMIIEIIVTMICIPIGNILL